SPDEGWRAALIAADVVITDHGSLTCYAAALGRPVLLAADGDGEVVPGSPMDTLRTELSRVDTSRPFAPQFDHALATHDPARMIARTAPIFAHHGQAGARLRATICRLLSLSPAPGPVATDPIPTPMLSRHRTGALIVRTSADHGTVTLSRYPAALRERWHADDDHAVHLVAYVDDGDLPTSQSAAVLVAPDEPRTIEAARTWTTSALTRFPGARLAAARATDRIVLGIRPHDEVHLVPASDEVDVAAWASGCYACLTSGEKLLDVARLTVHIGSTAATADVVVT
ncbi:MAG TPA: hypothetical protein VGK33_14150, partial [Chloroflexota bacterium]